MQYHRYVDEYEAFCSLPHVDVEAVYHTDATGTIRKVQGGGKFVKPGWREWYRTILSKMLGAIGAGEERGRSEFNLGVSEFAWRSINCPYYNVHPRMLPVLGGLSLPDIPAKLVKFVHVPYVVQFPVDEPSLVLDEKHRVQSALCMLPDYISDVAGAFHPEAYLRAGVETSNRLIVWVDFGEVYQGLRVKAYKQLDWQGDDTLQQAYHALPFDPDYNVGLQIPLEVMKQVVKIVLGVGFVAADPDNGLVQPHLLSADNTALSQGDAARIQSLHQKAVRKWGRLGYVIGDDSLIERSRRLGNIPAIGGTPERCLQWQHIVGMHWKIVHYGPNHSLSRPQLILPYRRGKDLPFRPA